MIVAGRLWGPDGNARVSLLLDTGASRTLLNPRPLTSVGIDLEGLRQGFAMTTVSGTARAPMVVTPGLAAFGVYRQDFEVVAPTLPPSAPIDGLLGLDFLVGLHLTLDMKAGELTIES